MPCRAPVPPRKRIVKVLGQITPFSGFCPGVNSTIFFCTPKKQESKLPQEWCFICFGFLHCPALQAGRLSHTRARTLCVRSSRTGIVVAVSSPMSVLLSLLLGWRWAACVSGWNVLPDTDWPSHAPGAPSGFKAHTASACADECLKIPTCVAISWNECGAGHPSTADCWCK